MQPLASCDELFDGSKVSLDDSPALEARKHRRENVGGPADGRRVAQPLRGFANRRDHLFPAGGAALAALGARPGQGARTQDRPRPGPKILGAETPVHGLLDVRVDVSAPDIDPFPVLAPVLEDFAG